MLNKENYEKFKSFGEVHDNDKEREAFNKLLNALTQEEVISNESMQAVVGFDQNDKPVFWDLEKDDLLSYCECGAGTYLLGQDLPILSLELRFGKDKFAYYVATGDGAQWWRPEIDNQCLGYFDYKFAKDGDSELIEYVNKLFSVVDERINMTAEQLEKQPFLLFVFPCLNFCRGADKLIQKNKELIDLIVKNRSKIKAAVYNSDYDDRLAYAPLCDFKHATLEGKTRTNDLDVDFAKLKSENYLAAYFTDCDGEVTKVKYPNYTIFYVLRGALKKKMNLK